MSTTQTWHTIREASELCGMPESTLRYYEQAGIIGPIARDPSSRHRVYTDTDIHDLVAISCLQATGMPLASIRQYMQEAPQGKAAALRQIELLEEQAERLHEQMEDLLNQQRYVAFKQRYWRAIAQGETDEADRLVKEHQDLIHEVSHQQRQRIIKQSRFTTRRIAQESEQAQAYV